MNIYGEKIIKYLMRCRPGWGRLRMRPWEKKNEREPDYSGHALLQTGVPVSIDMWIHDKPTDAVAVHISNLKIVDGRDGQEIWSVTRGDNVAYIVRINGDGTVAMSEDKLTIEAEDGGWKSVGSGGQAGGGSGKAEVKQV